MNHYSEPHSVVRFIVENRNKIFWTAFILMAISIALSPLTFLFLDVILALVVIVLGVQKLSEESVEQQRIRENRDMDFKLDQMTEAMAHMQEYERKIEERVDLRFFKLDNRRDDVDKKIRSNYKDISRQMNSLKTRVVRMNAAMDGQKKTMKNMDKTLREIKRGLPRKPAKKKAKK